MPFLHFKFIMTDWSRLCLFLYIGGFAILSVLANSSCYLIWPHLVCIPDHYCGFCPYLANGVTGCVSVPSMKIALLFYMVEI